MQQFVKAGLSMASLLPGVKWGALLPDHSAIVELPVTDDDVRHVEALAALDDEEGEASDEDDAESEGSGQVNPEDLREVDGEEEYDPRVTGGGGGTTKVPGTGGKTTEGGKLRCRTKTWKFPYFWAPLPNASKAGKELKSSHVGFYYEAELIFDNDPPYSCACCVFRLFIRTAHSMDTPGTTWEIDKEDGTGKVAGGDRPNGSPPDGTKDDPNAGLGEYTDDPDQGGPKNNDGCIFAYDDKPGVESTRLNVHGSGGPAKYTLFWDMLGVVYDRCNNWPIESARRFMFIRHITISQDANNNKVLTDSQRPRLNKDVPLGRGAGAWNPGDKAPMPGTAFPRLKLKSAKRYQARRKLRAEREKKRRAK